METHIAIVTEMRKIAATAGVLMLNDWEMALSEVQMEHVCVTFSQNEMLHRREEE